MKFIHQKFLSYLLLCSFIITLSACGGRNATPVMVTQYKDASKSCEALEYELHTIENEIQRLLPEKDKTGKNVALGVAGAFLLVPWFFMDFKNAEAQEYEAYRQRYNHLSIIAIDKKCDIATNAYPSIQELQSKAKESEQKESKENYN